MVVGSRLVHSTPGSLGKTPLLFTTKRNLEPAFQELLVGIEAEQNRCRDFRPLKTIELTATSRGEGESFGLTALDEDHPEIRKRIEAGKTITLHKLDNEKELAETIVRLALEFKDSNKAILVFVRSVEGLEKVAGKLPKGATQRLTGTLRGLERDKLRENDPVFRRFLPRAEGGEQTVYLVCTSAGEVGVNISADHLVCDLSTFESMAQRFGRVNRFGNCRDTKIRIVHPVTFDVENELNARLENTLALLRQLKNDGSPLALSKLDATERLAAFSPLPQILPTSDILFDSWAHYDSRQVPGRPPVEPYLHGVSDWEPPQTQVAWRYRGWFSRGRIAGQLHAGIPSG